jgi:hypothetical protein
VRGFLRAYASYLGLDGRLFVDEYASRFGTRHDDELFRRRRERPMTQPRESSSAVLVALIAVVAIGVLFFVAWRFGPGEATPPAPGVITQTVTKSPNANPAATPATTVTTEVTTSRTPVRQPVHLRVDVSPDRVIRRMRCSWNGDAKRDAAPGRWEPQDRQGFAIETAIPGNVPVAVNGLFFALVGAKGPDRDGGHAGPARRAGHDPAAGRRRAAVTVGRPAAAVLVTGQELPLASSPMPTPASWPASWTASASTCAASASSATGATRSPRACASWPVTIW